MKSISKILIIALLLPTTQLLQASSLTNLEFLQTFNQNPKDPKSLIFKYKYEGSTFIGLQKIGENFQSKEFKPTGEVICLESVKGNNDVTTPINCSDFDTALKARGLNPYGKKLNK